MRIVDILARIDHVTPIGKGSWQGRCPVHGDQGSKLLLTTGRGGACSITCLEGCATSAILGAIGLETADLAATQPDGGPPVPVEDNTIEEPEPPPIPTPNYEDVQLKINALRARTKGPLALPPHEVRKHVSALVVGAIGMTGKFLHDARLAYAIVEGCLVALDPGEQDLAQLLIKFGLLPGDALARDVSQALRLAAFQHGQEVQVHRSTYLDVETFTAHVLLRDGRVLVLTPGGTRITLNGDASILLRAAGEEPPNLALPLPSIDIVNRVLESFPCSSKSGNVGSQRAALLLWMVSSYVPEALVYPPTLVLVGEAGAAVAVARWIGRLLVSPAFEVVRPVSTKELDGLVCSTSMVALDLCRNPPAKLMRRVVDTILGGIVVRADQGRPASTFRRRHPVIIALDRLDPRLAALAGTGAILEVDEHPSPEVVHHTLQARDQVLAELLGLVSQALPGLRARREDSFVLPTDLPTFMKELHLALGGQPEVDEMLAAVSGRANPVDEDPLIFLLDEWTQNEVNTLRWVTMAELHKELDVLARRKGTTLRYTNARALAQRFRTLRPILESRYGLEQDTRRSRKRVLRFQHGPLPRSS